MPRRRRLEMLYMHALNINTLRKYIQEQILKLLNQDGQSWFCG